MFGLNSTNTFSAGNTTTNPTSNGGLFGNNNNNNTSNTSGGLFGQSKPQLFGSGQTNGNTSSGLFGNLSTSNANNCSTNQTQGGLFGNSNSTLTTGGGLFGNSSNNTNNNNTSSGFSFGNTNTNNNAPSGTGLFSNKPSGAGLFGNSNNNSNTGNTFSLNNNTQSSGGLFGNSNSNTTQPSGGLFGNSNTNTMMNQNNNIPSLSSDPYGMSNLTRTTVQVGELMPSITEGTLPKVSTLQAASKRKRSATNSSISSPFVDNNTIIKNLSNQIRLRNMHSGALENVSGIFSPARNSLVEKFVPPTTTVGSIKSGKNFKQILASSKLTLIKKMINKRKLGSQLLLEDNADKETDDSLLKRRKMVNTNGLLEETPLVPKLLPSGDENESKILNSSVEFEDLNEVQERPVEDVKRNPDGYWCLPTVEDLNELSYDHLSNVEDFTIGRVGFGQIAFNYPVDLTAFKDNLAGEMFGGVVRIKDKSVQVYPSSYDKPEVGMGLNVPATITLENLAPMDSSTNTPILNPSRPEVKNHVKKLKNLKGMQFISYDPIVGTWVFRVGHFSIWGLVDSDNEEDLAAWKATQKEESNLEAKRLQRDESMASDFVEESTEMQDVQEKVVPNKLIPQKKPIIGTRSLIEDTFIYKIQKNNDSQPTAVIPGGWGFTPAPDPDVSATSLVHKRSENRPLTPEIESDVEEDDQSEKFDDILEPESPPLDESEIDVEIGSEIVDEKAYEPEIDEIDMAALEISSKFATSADWLEQLELASDSVSAFNSKRLGQNVGSDEFATKKLTIADLDDSFFGDFNNQILEHERITKEFKLLGKTFVHFTSDGKVIKKTKHLDTKNMSGVVESPIRLDVNPALTQNILNKLLSASTIVTRPSSGFPHVMPNRALSFDVLLASNFGAKMTQEKRFWDLCSRLFDNSRIVDYETISRRPKLVEIKRKQLVSSWFKKTTTLEISKLLMKNQMDPLETIYIQILSNDLVQAAETAMETNNNHLAILITLLGSNDSLVVESAQSQLDEWKRINALRFIPVPILKIYLLLAELPLVHNDLKIDLTEGLSWELSFSLLLNFTDKSVNECIREFEKSPMDLTSDVHFNVLRLYTYLFEIGSYDITTILDSFDNKELDYKVQWFLYEILVRSTGRLVTDDEQVGELLTLAFAEQLEQQGLYLESIFILSHLSGELIVQRCMYSLVTRHIFDIVPNLTDMRLKNNLTSLLKVPTTLLSELIALGYKYAGDYWNEVEALIEAQIWEDASLSVVKNIALNVVIGNNLKSIDKLDALIDRIVVKDLNDWNIGLGVYSNFIKLWRWQHNKALGNSIVPILQFLLDQLPNLERVDQSKSTKIASTLMSRQIGDAIIEINEKFIEKERILLLPMGESELSYFKRRITDDTRDVILD